VTSEDGWVWSEGLPGAEGEFGTGNRSAGAGRLIVTAPQTPPDGFAAAGPDPEPENVAATADPRTAVAPPDAVPTAPMAVLERAPDARPDECARPSGAGGGRGWRRHPRGGGDQARLAQGQASLPAVSQLSARRTRPDTVAASVTIAALVALWGAGHVLWGASVVEGRGSTVAEVYILVFAVLAWQVALCLFDRSRRASPADAERLARLEVVIAVPCYNEDPRLLLRALLSMVRQTRPPSHVYLVDDGSDKADYTDVRREFLAAAHEMGVRASWERTVNRGKRHAQAVAVRATPDADIYVTVDSDATLDPRALAELLEAFADPRVQSSAGIVLAANNQVNLLTRITDLTYVTTFLSSRASLSLLGSVLVNSGALAAYRAPVIRDNLDVYLAETFFGRRISFSDDSLLTMLAMLRGKTVQRPGAFAFAMMPERLSHHARQYLRWMRGSFIRAWWRFRYLPLRSYAYWWHMLWWILNVVMIGLFVNVYVDGVADGRFRWAFVVIPVLGAYVMNLRYLTVRRSDEPFWSRLLTWLLAPLAVAWQVTVMRAWRWYGALTWWKTGWGTRQDIEVGL
jgi:hyaluronan synthase